MKLEELDKVLRDHSFTDEEVLNKSEQLGKDFYQKNISTTQLRKFYNQLNSLARDVSKSDEKDLSAQLRILQAQVAYSVGREQIEAIFKEFFDICSNKILKARGEVFKKLLKDFVKFFESVYGYFYYYEKKGQRRR